METGLQLGQDSEFPSVGHRYKPCHNNLYWQKHKQKLTSKSFQHLISFCWVILLNILNLFSRLGLSTFVSFC